MISKVILNIARFTVLLLLQVFIVGKLNVSTYIHPNIFVLFVLLLPINLAPAAVLFLAFFSGMALDMFTDTPGLNMTSLLVMAYVRIFYLRSFAHTDVIESGVEPNLNNMGFRWFFFQSLVLVFVHHLVYAFLESFSFRYFFSNVISTLFSTAITLVLILLLQFLFFRAKARE